MKTVGRLTILLTVFLLTPSLVVGSDTRSGVPSPEEAATPADAPGLRTFGVASAVAHTINAWAFAPESSSATHAYNGIARYLTGAGTWLAPVNLPAGALILGIEIQGCDTSPTGGLFALLWSATITGGAESGTQTGASVYTGNAATPGCGFFAANNANPPVVDNDNRTYWVQIFQETLNASNRFSAVRIFYVLQVSPAPATATFGDVPTTHPFFRFIQALAAAGITGGCSATPPLYCPDDPVTRGQMAVFIARALGLHFAP